MKKTYTWVVAAGALSALLTGCGSDGAASSAQKAESTQKQAASAQTAQVPKVNLQNAKDGTYTAESKPDDKGGIGRITITVADHKITAAEFVGIDKAGNVKAEEYGKTNGKVENPVFYKKAQLAVKANAKYAEELLQAQELAKVDAISGATVSYGQFMEAAKKALGEAGA